MRSCTGGPRGSRRPDRRRTGIRRVRRRQGSPVSGRRPAKRPSPWRGAPWRDQPGATGCSGHVDSPRRWRRPGCRLAGVEGATGRGDDAVSLMFGFGKGRRSGRAAGSPRGQLAVIGMAESDSEPAASSWSSRTSRRSPSSTGSTCAEGFGVHVETRRRRARSTPAAGCTPSPSSSTSACPGLDGVEVCRAMRERRRLDARAVRHRPRRRGRPGRSASSSAPTTTSPSRSRPASWSPGSSAVLRRQRRAARPRAGLEAGGRQLDPARGPGTVDGHEVALTATEFNLLARLMRRRGRVFDRARAAGRRVGAGRLRPAAAPSTSTSPSCAPSSASAARSRPCAASATGCGRDRHHAAPLSHGCCRR